MPAPPSAILVCSEIMTGAALRCFKDHGVDIPAALSLVGFDDPAWASFFTPAITTLREQRFHMGRLACDALIAAIQDPSAGFRQTREIVLRTELIVRESCAAPRRGTAMNHPKRNAGKLRRAGASG
jgi:LacI family transcriptional regulator